MKFNPFQFFFLGIFILLFAVILLSKPRPTLHDLFDAINSVDQNPTAIVVLVIGCIMIYESKILDFPDELPASIVGAAIMMLKTQMTAKTHTDASGKTTTDIVVGKPDDASNDVKKEV